jgi:hypothetical protein
MLDAVSEDPAVAEQAQTRLAENVEDPEYPQVRAIARARGAVCKTVGSAHVGSNPTPATDHES